MSVEERLRALLGRAYHARQQGSVAAVASELATELTDSAFRAHAKAEQARLRGVSKRCFVSKIQAEFLRSALDT